MHEKDLNLVETCFKKYYFDHYDLIHVPENPTQREFGYQKFDSGMTRHISIKDDKELHLILIKNTPSDVYCSNAYYSFPNLPMAEKDWQRADLIFDIDAKDLNLKCRSDHTCHKCSQCNQVFLSHTICPHCNSSKIEKKSLSCQMCIDGAKKEVKKLVEILTDDLGIDKDEIKVYFSGNEGFHVYAYNSQYQKLGSKERAELVDYLMLRGAIPETFGFKRYNPNRSSFPYLDEKSWRGRVSKEIFGSKSKRSKLITQLITEGYDSFQKKLESVSQTTGVKIDPNVTMDIHRIFRLPGSLNSKSGLAKLLCQDIEKFNPYSDACFIDDNTIEVVANCPIQFKLKNKKFGPYKMERISLPNYAAVYMICKGIAKCT